MLKLDLIIKGYFTVYTPSTAAGVGILAIFGAFLLLFFIMFLLYLVPAIVLYWRIFTKAGKPGWQSIVPVYNAVVLADIAKQPMWIGWTLAGVEAVNILMVNNNSSLSSLLNLASAGLFIFLIVKLSAQFNKGTGFWVLTVLLPIVAVFMSGDLVYKNLTPAAASAAGSPAAPVAPAAPAAPVAPAAPAAPVAPVTEAKPEAKPKA